ncbi:DgyrCDS7590 [Dimorphilus gyrociliatus]|uniref:DgyrCDS7590 n=1 Tax=Dimorphilus gyrociliatus TaxID=2664684 RepID=A0A7I8VSG2_9ANNE|nr:DgyrCDS7590 [Dimorphilus gyrociliatus]
MSGKSHKEYSDEVFKLTLERNLVYLTEHLELQGLFLTRLQELKIIDGNQVDDIKQQGVRYKMATSLLDKMIRKAHLLGPFLLALDQDGQTHIRKKIENYLPLAEKELQDKKDEEDRLKEKFGIR